MAPRGQRNLLQDLNASESGARRTNVRCWGSTSSTRRATNRCHGQQMPTATSHHYVPQWLQRRFLEGTQRLWYLDLTPDFIGLPDSRVCVRDDLKHWGPKRCFCVDDLYCTHFAGTPADAIEKEFFGPIDGQASDSIQYFATGEYAPSNSFYGRFLKYLSAQKLRTPKGLDWLRKFAGEALRLPMGTAEDLMSLLRSISEMHITTWSEAFWEVVSADGSEVGFLLSDHPVTVYNCRVAPTGGYARYPLDPPIEMVGTRTIFPLDSRTCLILSNMEFIESPSQEWKRAFAKRTNGRAFGVSWFSPEFITRGRVLTTESVIQLNYILKKRARRYVAAPHERWLYPEHDLRERYWPKFDETLRPTRRTVREEVWMEFSDGTQVAFDAFGRPITDAEKWREMERFRSHIQSQRR